MVCLCRIQTCLVILIPFSDRVIALIAGGIVGAIPGILRAYLGTRGHCDHYDELHCIVCRKCLYSCFSKDFMQSTDSTIRVECQCYLSNPWLSELTGNSRIEYRDLLCHHCCWCDLVLLKKTTLGFFEIRAVGLNPHASEYAGISAKRTIILSMVISGALAGLGGAVEGLGTFQNVYVQGSSLAIGFNGMAVGLLAGKLTYWNSLCSLLIWSLQVGAPGMNAATSSV